MSGLDGLDGLDLSKNTTTTRAPSGANKCSMIFHVNWTQLYTWVKERTHLAEDGHPQGTFSDHCIRWENVNLQIHKDLFIESDICVWWWPLRFTFKGHIMTIVCIHPIWCIVPFQGFKRYVLCPVFSSVKTNLMAAGSDEYTIYINI